MNAPRRRLAPLPAAAAAITLCASAAATTARAGSDGDHQPVAISAAARGLDVVAGELWAVGATYKARFDRGGPMIVPPLGSAAPRSLPLWLAFESAEIGGATFVAGDGTAEPARGELEVRYRHGPALTERYEVRSEGLEQSFVFAELPAERGELVVRLRIATELAPRADGAGLFFEGTPGRGLRYGALEVADARGRRAAGRVRLAGGAIELVAPADFVAMAELPLVLDPLIGGPIDVSQEVGEVGDPDLDGLVTHFVVFDRRWAANDLDVYGQRLTSLGTYAGSTVLLEVSVEAVAQNPSVARGTTTSSLACYLAVWQEGATPTGTQDIVGRPVSDATGAMSPAIKIAATSASETDPDVVNATHVVPPGTLVTGFEVVWARAGIRARKFQVNSLLTIVPVGLEAAVSVNSADTRPVIASAHNTAPLLVVWERFFTAPAPGDHDLRGSFLTPTATGATVGSEFQIVSTVGPDETRPRVSGVLSTYYVAHESSPSLSASDDDVFLRTVFPPASVSAAIPIDTGAGSDDHAPAVTWQVAGTKIGVAWVQEGGIGNSLRMAGVHAATCGACVAGLKICEPSYVLAGAPVGLGFSDVEVVPGLAAYESIGFGVYAQAFDPMVGGPIAVLGVGCAGGGAAEHVCPAAPSSAFAHRLNSAAPMQPAFLIVGLDRIDAGCGSCTLVPDPFTGFVISAGATDATGDAEIQMPIPGQGALVGLKFFDQWAVVPGPSPCGALGATLSTALEITIQ